MAASQPKVLSTADVAKRMGVSTASVRRYAIDKLLKGRKLGARSWVFDPDEVERFIRDYDASIDPSLGGGPRGPRSRQK